MEQAPPLLEVGTAEPNDAAPRASRCWLERYPERRAAVPAAAVGDGV